MDRSLLVGVAVAGLVNLIPAQIEARNSACDHMSKATVPYKAKVEELTRRLSQFEQVYTVECKAQEDLLHTADRLE